MAAAGSPVPQGVVRSRGVGAQQPRDGADCGAGRHECAKSDAQATDTRGDGGPHALHETLSRSVTFPACGTGGPIAGLLCSGTATLRRYRMTIVPCRFVLFG